MWRTRRVADELTFEEAFERLEANVRRLEEGGLPLEESIGVFEETMRLVRLCNDMLDGAELRISEALDGFDEKRGTD